MSNHVPTLIKVPLWICIGLDKLYLEISVLGLPTVQVKNRSMCSLFPRILHGSILLSILFLRWSRTVAFNFTITLFSRTSHIGSSTEKCVMRMLALPRQDGLDRFYTVIDCYYYFFHQLFWKSFCLPFCLLSVEILLESVVLAGRIPVSRAIDVRKWPRLMEKCSHSILRMFWLGIG